MKQCSSVLIVDDEQDIRELVMEMLEDAHVPCLGASNGASALEMVHAQPNDIDVIVLDVNMPGIEGTEVLRTLQSAPATAHIPIIMMSAKATSHREVASAVDAGASDYLSKPCAPAVLLAKVLATRSRALADREMRVALALASRSALEDPLTGLFNRRHFRARIEQASAHAKRHDEPFALIMLDLDHFKLINDGHGHEEGDRVLATFAAHLRAVLRADDVPFRYGGEEFAVLLHACDAARAKDVSERLRSRLRAQPHCFADGRRQPIAFSAGVAAALFAEGFDGNQIVSRADQALFASKRCGRDQVQCWRDLLRSSMLPCTLEASCEGELG